MPQQITLNFLTSLYTGVQTSFNKWLGAAPSFYKELCLTVDSQARDEIYPRMDMLPGVREWVGDRVINSLSASSYSIRNKTFEFTLGINREDLEDDRFGMFNLGIQGMGMLAGEYPDRLMSDIINNGGSVLGPDGQYFFDTDHDDWTAAGAKTTASNYQSGSGAPWYLLDLSRPLKPFVFQLRRPFAMVARQSLQDPAVFDRNQFLWGTDGRMNAGYGEWRTAYKSKADLTKANIAAAVAAMGSRRRPDGAPIAITPTHLVVPKSLEGAGRAITKNQFLSVSGGSTENNEWMGAFELRVIPWLANS